jgi:DNA replication ATP-dependent helicase Dna2
LDDDHFLQSNKKNGLEISTIDRYQGRDKEAIVLSLVRSNPHGRTGRLLEDYRRLNVALSRAKRKLIIIGSCRTMTEGSKVLQPIMRDIQNKKWIETLPENATKLYHEPIVAVQ